MWWKQVADGIFAAFVGFGAFTILVGIWIAVWAITSWCRRGD
jgi:uncharacterized membrane protein